MVIIKKCRNKDFALLSTDADSSDCSGEDTGSVEAPVDRLGSPGTQEDIYKAAQSGNVGRLRSLVRQGLDPSLGKHTENGKNALHFAAMRGKTDAVKFLVNEAEVDIDSVDYEFHTPLHEGAWGGKLEVVKFLVSKGADLNAQDSTGETALHKAAWLGRLPVVQFLADKGINVNVANKQGKTALQLAQANGQGQVVGFLSNSGPQRFKRAVYSPIVRALMSRNANEKPLLLTQDGAQREMRPCGTDCGPTNANLGLLLAQNLLDKMFPLPAVAEEDSLGRTERLVRGFEDGRKPEFF